MSEIATYECPTCRWRTQVEASTFFDPAEDAAQCTGLLMGKKHPRVDMTRVDAPKAIQDVDKGGGAEQAR